VCAHSVKVVPGTQIVVVAKEPVPGRVKTRLCPPCTDEQAARLAEAALADTIDAVCAADAARRILLLEGDYRPPPGWEVVPQRGDGLGQRLANGFADAAAEGVATVLIGMDTPQVTAAALEKVLFGLSKADSVLGPADDGGWWALALRDSGHARVLADVPMSQPDTGRLTAEALRGIGVSVAFADSMRDVDTFGDLRLVAGECPGSRFAAAVNAALSSHSPAPGGPAQSGSAAGPAARGER
jgi:glycosyltransferase A (GT-A) superfamily protein (DUF2064 family)